MVLTGLHVLISYQCTFECDHCFVWGSPFQNGTMTLQDIRTVLDGAKDLGTVEWIYFEGGEPTLFYPILLKAVQLAASMDFRIGIVSNTYWATSLEDAVEWLRPFTGLVEDLSISSDLYHYSEKLSRQTQLASAAAKQLDLPLGVLSIAQPEEFDVEKTVGQLPTGESVIMYRGRAAEKLSGRAPHHPWDTFIECPFEDLHDPGRIHVDPLGYLHICQGISIGNMYAEPLSRIWSNFCQRAIKRRSCGDRTQVRIAPRGRVCRRLPSM